MKRIKWILAITLILFFVAAVILLAGYILSVKRYQAAVGDISYHHVDASGIPDGTYTGECDVTFIYAKVNITVKDGVITKIDLLEHQNERGKAAEGIGQEIVALQRIDVDAVAGATNSSTVIKKAVDNALSAAIL